MKKTKAFVGMALAASALMSQAFANEAWEWQNENDCYYEDACCGGKILFLEEFLYWTPGNYFPFVNNDFVNTGAPVTSPTAPFPSVVDTFNEPYVRISDKWSTGIRLGLGWQTENCWQLWGVWTGYSNYARRVINSTPPAPPLVVTTAGINEGFLTSPVIGDPFALPLVSGITATGTYKLNYNVADLVFGKNVDLWGCFKVMPFAGVRASFIHQRDRVKLQGLTSVIPGVGTAAIGTNSSLDQQLWCVGPRLGVEATWGDWHGFNLLGNISAAILFGRFEETLSNSRYLVATDLDGGPVSITTLNVLTQDNYSQIVPNLQVSLGFGYDFSMDLIGKTFDINFFALWEGNAYWGASNRLIQERELTLNGLTTGIALSF